MGRQSGLEGGRASEHRNTVSDQARWQPAIPDSEKADRLLGIAGRETYRAPIHEGGGSEAETVMINFCRQARHNFAPIAVVATKSRVHPVLCAAYKASILRYSNEVLRIGRL